MGHADLSRNQPGESLRRLLDEQRVKLRGEAVLAQAENGKFPESALEKGLRGEIEVAKRLPSHEDGWFVINSIPVSASGTDIDHLVIGPSGVFTLNTKNHLGGRVWLSEWAIWVNGHGQDYLRISRSEAIKVSRILSKQCGFEIQVRPIIVIIADDWTVKGEPKDVQVESHRTVRSWLQSQPATMSHEMVVSIYRIACDRSTWIHGRKVPSAT